MLLFAVSLLQYSYSINNDFVVDSIYAFAEDKEIRDLSNIPGFFIGDQDKEPTFLSIENLKYYRPLLKTIHSLEYQVFGTNPLGYNIVNIFMNALVVVLAFLFVLSVSGSRAVSFWSALLYSVNPSRVEAVSWAYSDAYIISAALVLICLLMYHRRRFVLSIIFYLISLMVFEGTVLATAVIASYLLLFKERRRREDYLCIASFILLSVLYLLFRKSMVGPTPITEVGLLSWLNGASVLAYTSIKVLLLPTWPVALYIYKPGMFSQITPGMLLPYFSVACIVISGVFLYLREKKLLFWFLWFFVWPSVFLNMGRFGEFYFNDKVLYLASLGPCVMAIRAGLSIKRFKRVFMAALVVLIAAHFAYTYSRTLYWKDNDRYMAEARKAAPDSIFVHNWFGRDFAINKMYVESRREYEASISLYRPQPVVHLNLGNIYYLEGDIERAIESWRESIRYGPDSPEAYNNLCIVLSRNGDNSSAKEFCRRYEELKGQ